MPNGFRNSFLSSLSRESAHDKEESKRDEGSSSTGGALNTRQQLENSYAKLLKSDGAGEAWRQEFFRQVRILVLGRSGVGKTTLIRLIVGKDGPDQISDQGVACDQDINKEFVFSSQDQGIPLFIHDSNGIDVRGSERVDEIKEFLDKHQKADDFSERIHLVWYVISAIDNRCVEDRNVMKMICDYKIPLLLIMTHDDYDKKSVTDRVLDMLLQNAYAAGKEREDVKNKMVRVGNDGVTMGENGELLVDNSKRDTKGLKQVVERSRQLLDKNLRHTWIAAQAVDMEAKLEESAGIIAGFARKALFTSLISGAIPFADPLTLAIIFYRLVVIMSQIWLVPSELKKALIETLLQKEGSCHVLRRFVGQMVYLGGLVINVGATLLTYGVALPSAIAGLAEAGVASMGQEIPVLVKTFALQVLGTILYVKSSHEGSSRHRWRPGVSKEAYMTLCEEFAHNADYQRLLVDFAKKEHSRLDIALHKNKVKGMIKNKIVTTYSKLLLGRRNSFSSLLAKLEAADEGVGSTAGTQAPPARPRPLTTLGTSSRAT